MQAQPDPGQPSFLNLCISGVPVDLFPASTLLPGETPHGVNPREARLLELSTGYYTVAELAQVLQKPAMTVAKDLYGLVMAGHVTLKGLRSGRPPKVDPPAAEAPRELTPVSQMLGGAPSPAFPAMEDQTAIVRLQPPPPQGFPDRDEPLPETVGGGIAGGTALQAGTPAAPAVKPAASGMDDPQRMVKLMNFTQRIAQASKTVLPEVHHEMVNRLQAKATQQIISGDGPEAVKGLALAISRSAVDAGCDADMVRALNTHLKSLFTTK